MGNGHVPDALAPPPRHPRFPLVDGMRAIAVLSVLVVHVAVYAPATGDSVSGRLLSHLNIGVTIFFLISGFLLYRPFVAKRTGGPEAPPVDEYAKRRALRIVPAYWLALTVLTLVPGVVGVVNGNGLAQYALVWTTPIGDGGCSDLTSGCGLAQTWSLVVEATFYAALPLYALAAGRFARGRETAVWMRAELAVLAVLGAASVGAQFVTADPAQTWLSSTLLGYLLWFALGMALALVSVALGGTERRPRAVELVAERPGMLWLGAIGAYAALAFILPGTPYISGKGDQVLAFVGYSVIAALLLAPAVLGAERGNGLPRRFLANPVVAWLGLVSYGIFLWHFAVAYELGVLGEGLGFWPLLGATLAISVACAAASYYALERPLLRLKYQSLREVLAARRPAASRTP